MAMPMAVTSLQIPTLAITMVTNKLGGTLAGMSNVDHHQIDTMTMVLIVIQDHKITMMTFSLVPIGVNVI